MSFATLSRNANNILFRNAKVYVAVHDGSGNVTGWKHAGIVKNVKVGWKPRKTSADSFGRTFTRGYDFTLTFDQMQTGDIEIAAASTISAEYAGGTTLKFVQGNTSTEATPGLIFENVSPESEGNLDFNGGESDIKWQAMFQTDATGITSLGTAAVAAVSARGIIIGDKVVTAA